MDMYDLLLAKKLAGSGGGGGGGGGSSEPKRDVNFYDYDGTIVKSYSAADFASLTALPENPSHEGLTAQGWNWSLTDAKTYVAANGMLEIGQMYETASGETEIDVVLDKGRLAPQICLNVNGTAEVDWGDGTAKSTLTGTSVYQGQTADHTYAAPGAYTVKVKVTSGEVWIYGSSSASRLFRKNASASDNQNRVYFGIIRAVRFGKDFGLGSAAFAGCTNLEYCTIPKGMKTKATGGYCFYKCPNLKHLTIPSDFDTISANSLQEVGFRSVSIPNSIEVIGQNNIYTCPAIERVTIAGTMTSFANNTCNTCVALREIRMPNTVTTINNTFAAGGPALRDVKLSTALDKFTTNPFYESTALAYVSIPASVTALGSGFCSNCYGLGLLHFEGSTPPAWTSGFSSVPTDCVIEVPSGSLSAYTGASGYPSSSNYTYREY